MNERYEIEMDTGLAMAWIKDTETGRTFSKSQDLKALRDQVAKLNRGEQA